MEFTTFVRKPFTVEAVEITDANIEEIAGLIGSLKHKENGTPYIQVNRRLVPNLFRVYPGFWMTKMGDGDNIRCYSNRVFQQQFVVSDASIDTWIEYINANNETKVEVDEVDQSRIVEADVVDPAEEDAYAAD